MTNKEKSNSENNRDIEINVSYTDKHVVETGELVDVPCPSNLNTLAEVSLERDGYLHLSSFPIESKENVPFGLGDLQKMYDHNGGNTQEIYDQMKQYIMDNIDNERAIQYLMGNFCSSLSRMYTDDGHYVDYGDDVPEVFGEILSRPKGDMGKSFVCMNIAQLGMDVLHDCGIDAVILSGLSESRGGHATILYKSGDGKYTHIDYGTVKEITAPSMKEAALTVYSKSKGLCSNGKIAFIDNNKSYSECALEDVAVWGDELDKRDYNSENVNDKYYVEKSRVSVGVDYSTSKDVSARVEYTKANVDEGHIGNLTAGAAMRKDGKSALFNSSESAGFKLEYKGVNIGDKTKTHSGIKAIGNYVSGEIEGRDVTTMFYSRDSFMESMAPAYEEFGAMGFSEDEISFAIEHAYKNANLDNTKYKPDERIQYITAFLRGYFAVESDLVKTDNVEVSNMAEASVTGDVTSALATELPIAFDYRLAVEDGVKFAMKKSNTDFSTSLSAGALFDCQRTTGRQIPKFSPGLKLNTGSVFETRVGDNLSAGGSVSGYAVFTAPAADYGATANTFVSYKNSDNIFTASAGVGFDYQKMHIGGFDEVTENNRSFNVSLSAQNKDNTFYVGYNGKIDNINNTRNKSTFNVGYRRTF